MLVFRILYWVGLLVEILVRRPFQQAYSAAAKAESHTSQTEKIILNLLPVGVMLFPLIYSTTHWLDFANYSLPGWMGWAGVLLFIAALLVFAKAHQDLKTYWSPTLEIFEGHKLMKQGIYGIIRHPMYASQWLWCLAQILLLQNWLAGPLDLILFIPFYILRTRAEERMMTDAFGDEYRQYMRQTGAVLPRLPIQPKA